MGMLSAMYSGVTGLNVHGRALSSVADNIANLNTHAYKSTRANFGDIMVHSLTVGGTVVEQVGTGARVLNVQTMMIQGAFETTDLPTDLAINGQGFFEVSNPSASSNSAGYYYTRAGQFVLDKDGYLVNPTGLRLRGYNVDSDGNLQQIMEDLQITTVQTDAVATSQVDVSVNLDAEDSNEYHPSLAISPTQTTTYNYLTSVRVYDSLGIGHDLSLLFQKLSTYDGAKPAGSQSVWKCSVFENDGGTLTANPTYPDNTFYLHFDTNGHIVGISTGQPGYGDMYTSTGTVSSQTSMISDRLGETLSYSTNEGGTQTFISTIDVVFGGATEGDESISIGSTSYSLPAVSATSAALALASDINDDGSGYWAVANGTTVTLYASGSTPLSVSVSDSDGDETISLFGDPLSDSDSSSIDLIHAINDGRQANGMFAIKLANLDANDDLTINGTVFTYSSPAAAHNWTTIGQLVDSINSASLGVTATRFDYSLSGTTVSSITITATSVGTAGNSIYLDSNADSGSEITVNGRTSGTTIYLAGGMDPSSTTYVEASAVSSGSGYALRLSRTDVNPTSSSTIGIASSNTLGDTKGIDFDSWTQNQYASDPQSTSSVETDGEITLQYDFPDATQDQDITFDFTPEASSNTTQSAGSSETYYLYQNGSPRGSLQSMDIDRTGLITGLFSNGKQRTLGAVVLVNFGNPAALERQGENLWTKTLNSGEPVYNRPGQGGMGKVESGALEQSNVDLANEFVKMINYQRAFQANSRTISTTDQMLAELINLKR